MTKKKRNTNEISAPIIGIGSQFVVQGGQWVGLPGFGIGHAKYVDATIYGQFVVASDNMVWLYVKYINLYSGAVLNNEYPMYIKVSSHNFSWGKHGQTYAPGHADDPAYYDPYVYLCYKEFTVDNTGQWTPGSVEVPWGYTEDRGDYYVHAFGETVNSDNGWVKVGYLSQLDKRPDGVHIWFGGRAHYSQEDDPINPAPYEFVMTYEEIPVPYYPGSIFVNNSWVSSNSDGHYDKVYIYNRWEDVQCIEGDAVTSQDQANVYKNNQWGKALKY